MSKRDMPKATVSTRPNVRTEVSEAVINHWNPDLRAEVSGENSISVFDPIGADWYGEGVTANRVAAALRRIGHGAVTVNINSPGGDFFEGLAIYNLLREHPGEVTVKILGMAASAASVIAMAGDEVQIARAGFLMIHNTWVCSCGDRHALRDVADWLEPFDEVSAEIYAARTGIDGAEIVAMLDKETWISGARAVERGFADSLLGSDEIAADPKAEGTYSPHGAASTLDLLLSRAGVSRSQRRRLVAAVKGGKPDDAAPSSKPSAAVAEGLQSLLTTIQNI